MKKIALFAIAALIGTASFAAPKGVKAVKKAPAKTEAAAKKTAQDSTASKKTHHHYKAAKAGKTAAAPKA
ncbi:hypothetical protein GA0116948_1149 [Chitinophaga costaii]|uniref:Acid shock protein n=1 Tax=Chitinophaga costaii TaxID=1335309 RepID=A0A1C4FF73_9BACT|nr:hypothetical protein [Chitinophaga costaii]PUZ20122.1 hypothetical protein DCM91_19510 [Chitinophaga costaii]SCC54648.1 hypothetical protein GA0116948_1149 [Chitinophaga costaii]